MTYAVLNEQTVILIEEILIMRLSHTPSRFIYKKKIAVAIKIFRFQEMSNKYNVLENVTIYGYQQTNFTFKKGKGKECAVKDGRGLCVRV